MLLIYKTPSNIGEGRQLLQHTRGLTDMVYVLSMNGFPLMPCTEAKARHLMQAGKAICVKREPFTIKLTFECENKIQPITLGIDAGYNYIGIVASTATQVLFWALVELRNDIVNLLSTRLEYRRSRRNRKTRYRAARFDNRVSCKEGWLAPSVLNKIQAHLKSVKLVTSILPISIIVETTSFDIQKIKNPDIKGHEYQQGDQLDFWNVREYVLWRDGHECQHCHGKSKDKILNVHHIESRKTGGDTPNNLITLCETCHKAYHAGKIKMKQKCGQSFKAATFMGIMRWALYNQLKETYCAKGIKVKMTFGYLTKKTRIEHNFPKSHTIDAYCIAGNLSAKQLPNVLDIKQVREHNRQIYKMTIGIGGKRKLNQAPYLVHGFRLFDKVQCKGEVGFIFGRRVSGSFDVRKLDGTKISANISYKKLKLLEKRQTFLMQSVKASEIPLQQK